MSFILMGSTSLPFETQIQIVRSISGFENAHITRLVMQLSMTILTHGSRLNMENKCIKACFSRANQWHNGLRRSCGSRYWGINAALYVQEKDLVPRHDQAYMGVMMDDLITLGTQEPCRMFKSC